MTRITVTDLRAQVARLNKLAMLPDGALILHSQNPGDGRRYRLDIKSGSGEEHVSPSLTAREMSIYLDAAITARTNQWFLTTNA
jgi:hypothetical protein